MRPRQRTDVCAPVAADLPFVADAAERNANEPAVDRARDGTAERRLADPRRTDQAENRTLGVGLEPPDRQVLENPLLDPVQVVVILVEHAAGPGRGRFDPRSGSPTGGRSASRDGCGSSRSRRCRESFARAVSPGARLRRPPPRSAPFSSMALTYLWMSPWRSSPSPSSSRIARLLLAQEVLALAAVHLAPGAGRRCAAACSGARSRRVSRSSHLPQPLESAVSSPARAGLRPPRRSRLLAARSASRPG